MAAYNFKEWPAALQRQWLLYCGLGAGFLLVGLVMYIALRDRPLLAISGLLAACTALRCLSFYRTAREGRYEVVEGVCVALVKAGLRKQRGVRLLQSNGNEYAVTLDKRTPLRIGNCYRVYFRRDDGGRELFPDLLAGDLFLGLEDLGEYRGEAVMEGPDEAGGGGGLYG